MTGPQLRMILATVLATGTIVVACARRSAHVESVPGSTLGESTAAAPDNPSAPAPDAAGPREISSGPITGSTSGVPQQPQPAAPSGGAEATGPIASGGTVPVEIAPLAADGGVTGAPVDGGTTRTVDAGRPGLTDGGTRTIDAGAPRADGGAAPAPVDGGSPTRP